MRGGGEEGQQAHVPKQSKDGEKARDTLGTREIRESGTCLRGVARRGRRTGDSSQ